MKENCKYRVKGNLCKNEDYCEDKDAFERYVLLDNKKVYGVCDSASCF